MLANNNLKVCWTLVRRDFRFHRVKNAVLALAVALVTGLYAFVFLLGGAVEDAFLLNYQYTYGSTSHILYSGLTEHQADLLSQHPNVKSTVRLSTIGTLSDPMMGQRLVKLAVTDQDYAETVLSVPTTGSLPQKPGEIALDEFTMGSLGILKEIGAPVTLQWTDAGGETHTDTFTLCGWWASPTNFTEACAWITAETARTVVPDYDSENAANLTLGVTLHQPRDLDQQATQLLTDQGLPELTFTTNLSYNDARLELADQQARPYYAPALLVLVCGFLMILAIVQVTAEQDRAYFAGLKALGLSPPAAAAIPFGKRSCSDGTGAGAWFPNRLWTGSGHHTPGGSGDGSEPCPLLFELAALCLVRCVRPGHHAAVLFAAHPSTIPADARPNPAPECAPALSRQRN